MNVLFQRSFQPDDRQRRNFAFHKRNFMLTAMLALVLAFSSPILHAQCDHDAQRRIKESMMKGEEYIKFTQEQMTPGYWYGITYEKTCYIRYNIAEFKNNGSKIYLDNWCYNQNRNDRDAVTLTNESRTEIFTVQSNDKISFFREFFWETKNGKNKFDYFALDNLSWSVELMDGKTNEVLSVLDAIAIAKSYSQSVPMITKTQPLGAIVEYVVPEKFDGKSVYIRVNPRVEGEGGIKLTRSDLIYRAASEIYFNPNYFQNLRDAHAQKQKSNNDIAAVSFADGNNEGFSVSPNPSLGEVNISFKNASDQSQLKYSIYNSAGQLIDIISAGQNKYMFTQDGAYFVTATINGKNVASQKIIVTRK